MLVQCAAESVLEILTSAFSAFDFIQTWEDSRADTHLCKPERQLFASIQNNPLPSGSHWVEIFGERLLTKAGLATTDEVYSWYTINQ